jgi:alpha/beta superfamily hydrolase
VTFRSRDGIALRGWWFSVDGVDRAAVIVPGRGRNRVNSDFMPAEIAKLLLVHGYSVLLCDLRGHGESGGTRYTLGIEKPRDILAAIDLAASKADIARARVALIGESLGGGSVLMSRVFLGLDISQVNPARVVAACEHVMAFATHRDEWAQHVLGFLESELGSGRPARGPAGILAAAARRGG